MVYIILLCEWMSVGSEGGGGVGVATPCLDPLRKRADTFEETWSARKTTMKSDLYLREPAGAQICDIQRNEEGGGGGSAVPPSASPILPPPSSSSLLSCFLNACQESLMAVEFGQEKSGAGSFRGSGDLCLTKAAPLFVFSQADLGGGATRGDGGGGRASESVSSKQRRPLKLEMGGEGGFQSPDTCMTTQGEQYRHSPARTHIHT